MKNKKLLKVSLLVLLVHSPNLLAKDSTSVPKFTREQIADFVKNHTPAEVAAAQAKYGVSDDEVKAATGKPTNNEIKQFIDTHTAEEIKAAQKKYGVSDEQIRFVTSNSNSSATTGHNSNSNVVMLPTTNNQSSTLSTVNKEPNNYIPYARNLTPDQAKKISEKYKNVFGYNPSPRALELYGYQLKGTYPKSLDQIVSGIEKKNYNNVIPNTLTALEAGIDPDVYIAISGLSSAIDWNTVYNSKNPNEALRLSLGNILSNTTKLSSSVDNNNGDKYYNTLASSGNLVIKQYNCKNCLSVSIVDKAGNLVRSGIPFTSRGLIDAAYIYGLTFDSGFKDSLNSIAEQLDHKGIKYKPGEKYAGTGSDAGINLRDLAQGGTGTSSVPTMQHALWQANTSSKFLREDKNSYAYTQPIHNQATLEYRANSLNIDLSNSSANQATIAPQKDGDGKVRNFMVTSPGSGMVWFETAIQAQAFVAQAGGKVYDLRNEIPNVSVMSTVQSRNFSPPSISFNSFNVTSGMISSAIRSHTDKKTKKELNEIRVINETKSNPSTCEINIMSDLQIASPSVSASLNQKIANSNKKLTSLCKDAKSQDLAGVESAIFLNEYDYNLARTNLEILQDQASSRENIAKGLMENKTTGNELNAISNIDEITPNPNHLSGAVKLIQQSFMQNANTEQLLTGYSNASNFQYKIELDAIRERSKFFINERNLDEQKNEMFSNLKPVQDSASEKTNNLVNHSEPTRTIASVDIGFNHSDLQEINNDEIEIDQFIDYKNKNKSVSNSLNSSRDDSLFQLIKKAYLRNYDRIR